MALSDIDLTPPKGMVDAAKKGLELREEFGRGGTEVGVRTARRIIGNNISIDLVKKMYAYHERHQVDKQAEGFKKGEKGFPSAGYIALHLWGFDAGHRWSERKRNEIVEEENRMKVGTMISDGIELPLYDSIEEAELEAQKLGGSGYHEHTMDGETYYMPFKNHAQAKEVMKKVNDDMYKKNQNIDENRKLTAAVKEGLENKKDEHNDEVAGMSLAWDAKVSLSMLEKVFDRGVGAYKTNPGSVRPTVKSQEQWAYARVNSFLYAMKKGKYRSGKHDTDLLPSKHPVKKEQDKKNMDLNNLEKRIFNCKELRYHEDEHGKKKVRGYAAVFNELSEDLGNFREKINPDAFNNVLDNDVVALLNHDMDNLFGRTSNGTVKLSVDERGLFTEIDMPNTQLAKDTIELMERGDISQMSFGFYVGQDSWNKSDAGNIRTIEEISRLVDISLVTIPAYPQTSASVRSLVNNIENEQERKDNVQVRKNKLKMLKLKK
tara:strand:- start:1759 stop:3228 length:1470 start_codon:yes stop_codon:yes gene_type:complete